MNHKVPGMLHLWKIPGFLSFSHHKTKMDSKKAIVFIDGNNFYHNIKGSHIKPKEISFLKMSQHVCAHFNCTHEKTFYYNSVPDIRDGEKKYYAHIKFLNEIRKLPKFEVKTRKLQKHSTQEMLQDRKKHCRRPGTLR